jgi:hypothetical protein
MDGERGVKTLLKRGRESNQRREPEKKRKME